MRWTSFCHLSLFSSGSGCTTYPKKFRMRNILAQERHQQLMAENRPLLVGPEAPVRRRLKRWWVPSLFYIKSPVFIISRLFLFSSFYPNDSLLSTGTIPYSFIHSTEHDFFVHNFDCLSLSLLYFWCHPTIRKYLPLTVTFTSTSTKRFVI